MAPTIPEGRRTAVALAALVLLGLALYLPRLGASGLWDPWEPRYAQSAQNMSESGQWIVPVYRDDLRLNKPPLTYWLIAASQAVLGIDEAATRLPMALLAVLCAVVLAGAFAVAGRRLEGIVAGAALMTCPQWALTARFATPDIPLAAFLGLALAATLALPAAAGRPARWAWIGLAIGGICAAGLTDWPRGLVLPLWAVLGWGALQLGWKGVLAFAAVAGLYHAGQMTYSVTLNLASFGLAAAGAAWVLRTRAGISWRAQLAGAALVTALVAPWFVAAWRAAPGEMSLFEYAHALNLGEPRGEHTGPYVYPLRVATVGAVPWIAAAVVGLATGGRRGRDALAGPLSGAWIGALLFFTLSEAQMGHFYGVTQPALAGLAGIGTVALVRRRDWRLGLLALVALVGVAFVVWSDPSRLLETATVKQTLYDLADPLAPALVALSVWAAIVVVAALARRESWAPAALVPAAALSAWLGLVLVPALEAKKSVKPLWSAYEAEHPGEGRVGLVGDFRDTTLYYGRGRTVRLETPAALEQFLSGPGEKFLITPPKTYSVLEGSTLPGRFEVASRVHPAQILVRYTPSN